MKIISAGTPYLVKNPWSLAIQSGSTLALTAAWAMTLLAGAAAASAFPGIKNSARIIKKWSCLSPLSTPFLDTPAEQR
jgi:hypothetical protein